MVENSTMYKKLIDGNKKAVKFTGRRLSSLLNGFVFVNPTLQRYKLFLK